MALDLRAEPEHEAAAGEALEVPGDLRRHERAAREGDRDARAELQALGVLGDDHQREEGVMAGLRGDDGIVAGVFDAAGGVADGVDGGSDEGGLDFHLGAPFGR